MNFKFILNLFLFTQISLLPLTCWAKIENHMTLGLGSNWNITEQDTINHSIIPELVGYFYQNLNHRFWIGYGARIGYSSGQPEMPQAVRISERDIRAGLEAGLFYNWIVIPSIKVGSGVIHRNTFASSATPYYHLK